MWSWLLDNIRQINLYISVAMFLMGVVFWVFGKPRILSRGFAQATMFLWLAQWCVLAGMYIVMIKSPSSELLLLLLSDVQSLLVLAAGWTLFEGDRFSWRGIAAFSAVMLVVLIMWNGYYYPLDMMNPGRVQRVTWLAPSETLASLALPMLGLAMFIRYHKYGLPFLFLTVTYGGFQQAAYSATLLNVSDISQAFPSAAPLFLALGVGKMLVGATFYGMCLFALDDYASVIPPLEEAVEDDIRATVRKALGWAATSIAVPLLVGIGGKLVEVYFIRK